MCIHERNMWSREKIKNNEKCIIDSRFYQKKVSRRRNPEASVTHHSKERDSVVPRGRKMSATMKTNAAEGGFIAQLNFRVRCETLGHGEGVFLVRSDDPDLTRVRVQCEL